ncbi:putative nucleic acid-binding protein [Arabidopsis thaliana]
MESFHPLSLLKPSITGWCIRGRVVRTFLVSLVPSSKVMGLILADEHGMIIETTVGYKMSDHYKHFINEGEWVTITSFGVVENSCSVRATTHTFKIGFSVDTVVRLTSLVPAILHNRLASFSSIIDDEIDKSVLVAIYDVGELINTRPKQNNVDDLTLTFKISDNE